MPKQKSTFLCQECGYESMGWLGKCPACNQWNTFVEEIQNKKPRSDRGGIYSDAKPVIIKDIVIDMEV